MSVTGGLAAASVHVTGMSLTAYCGQANAASCVVGNWTTTHLVDTRPGLYSQGGGAGITMSISADGTTVIDFASMAPMKVTGKTYTADYTFGGHITGRLVLPKAVPAGSPFSMSSSGLDDNSLTVTVQVTSPILYTMGPLSLSALAKDMGSQASSMPDAPGTEGTWSCSGKTLVNYGPPTWRPTAPGRGPAPANTRQHG